MPTNEGRKRIAERLRKEAKTERRDSEGLWIRLEIILNGWKYSDNSTEPYVYYNQVFARLADLIDPEGSE